MKPKIFLKTIMFLVFTILIKYTSAQPQVEYFCMSPNKIVVTATNGTATTSPIVTSYTPPVANQFSNGIYDNNNALVFYIEDGNFYNTTSATPFGTVPLGGLTTEIGIAPFNCEAKKYHIFYVTKVSGPNPVSNMGLFYATVDMTGSGVLSTPTQLITNVGATQGGVAVGNLLTSGRRYAYAVTGNDFSEKHVDKIVMNSDNTISLTTLLDDTWTGAAVSCMTAEVDLSRNGDKLAWADFFTSHATVMNLDANGDFNMNTGIINTYSYGPQLVNSFKGVEFNAAGNHLYASGASDGIYDINLSNGVPTLVSGTSSYGYSQLEMGKNGFIYAMNAGSTSGTLIGIDPANNSLSASTFISNVTRVSFDPIFNNTYMATLPDQIDGFDYNTQPDILFHADMPTGTTTTWTPTQNPFGNVNPVRIRTSLTIPNTVNLRIDNMTIEFGPGAVLNVASGGTLRLYNTTLQSACPYTMWQGVNVSGTGYILMDDISTAGSEIYDAVKGINAIGTSAKVQVIDFSIFGRNEKDIVITNGNNSTNNIIRRSTFNHNVPLKDQALGADQNGGIGTPRYGITGVELLNCTTNVQVIGHTSSGQGNTFNEGQYGIYGVNSHFNSYRNTFNTIRTRGIFADGQYQSKTVNVTNYNTFNNNKTAIDAHYGINLTVQSNTFNNGTEHGLLWFYNNGTDLKVGDMTTASLGNTFNNQSWSAIFTNDNANAIAQITIARNTIQNSSYAYGILVQESSLTLNNTYQEMFISNNNISNIDFGIVLTNIKGYDNQQDPMTDFNSNTLKVQYNTINQFGVNRSGILGGSSPRIRTTNNQIYTTNNATSGNVGINFTNGYKGLIAQNTCKSYIGIAATLNMLDANITCNSLEENKIGIDLISEQLRSSSASTHGVVGGQKRQNFFTNMQSNSWDMKLDNSSQNYNKWVDPNTTDLRIDYSTALLQNPTPTIIVTGGTTTSCYNTIVGGGGNGLSIPEEEGFSFSDVETSFDDENTQWLVEYMLQSQQYERGINFVQSDNSFIPQLLEFENYFSNSDFETAAEIFHQLSPVHTFEKNFKEVYDVALGYRTEEIRKLYDNEIERLVAIALQNPKDAGPAVFCARAILKFKENMDFIDKINEPSDNTEYESNKTDETNSVHNSVEKIKVYPNPADEELIIETPATGLYFVTINNSMGQKVYAGTLNTALSKINTSQLISGLYLVELFNEETQVSYFEKITIK